MSMYVATPRTVDAPPDLGVWAQMMGCAGMKGEQVDARDVDALNRLCQLGRVVGWGLA